VTSSPTARIATAALFALGLAANASAQTWTPAQFKAACEAPGHTVTVFGTLKITSPTLPPPLVVVKSRCTVVFTPDSQFEADNVNMRFTGTMSFQANDKAGILFKKSIWSAPRLVASLTGDEGKIISDESRLVSTAGDLSIALGDYSELGVTAPLGGSGTALSAAGALTVSAGEKFSAMFETTSVRAGTGMTFSLAGPEAVFKANVSTFAAAMGQFSVSSPGAKAEVDLASTQVVAPGGISVVLPGQESKTTMSTTRLTAVRGSVTLLAGSPGNSFGVINLDKLTVRAGGAYMMDASLSASKGESVLNNSTIRAGAAILIRSDREGLTNVLNNGLVSPTEIRAVTGPSGACIEEGNSASAPIVAICQ
jgi:hypothetical protein